MVKNTSYPSLVYQPLAVLLVEAEIGSLTQAKVAQVKERTPEG
jgi:hypothetical protein